MAEVLTQEEVDALLSGLSGGAIKAEGDEPGDPASAIQYDFTNQDRIVRGRMPTLEMIHDRFTRLFRNNISGSLGRPIDIWVASSNITKFGEFMRGLPMPTSLHLFKMDPLNGLGLLVIEGPLVYALLDTYFGGRGGSNYRLEGRDFTPIEQKLIRRVVNMVLAEYRTSWKPVYPVSIEFVRSEINPQFVNVVPPSDVVTTVECEIELEHGGGRMQFCLPYSTLEPIKDKLRSGFQSEIYDIDTAWLERLQNRVEEVPVELRVLLGSASITGRELINLHVGDVITLNEDHKKPLPVYVADVFKFNGALGAQNGNRAIRILSRTPRRRS